MKTGIEQLTLDERLKYLRIMRARYQQADRQTKTALLDQMVAVTGLHRKSVLRQPGGDLQRHPRSTERSATYGPEVQAALAVIAESLDYVCAERRHPQVVTPAEYLAAQGELLLTPTLRATGSNQPGVNALSYLHSVAIAISGEIGHNGPQKRVEEAQWKRRVCLLPR